LAIDPRYYRQSAVISWAATNRRASWIRISLCGVAVICFWANALIARDDDPPSRRDKPQAGTAPAEPATNDASDPESGSADKPSPKALLRLTFSPDPKVRRAALESLSQTPPTEELRARVKKMATSDDNSVVRGYARLLAADWALPSDSAGAAPTASRATKNPKAQSRADAGLKSGSLKSDSKPGQKKPFSFEELQLDSNPGPFTSRMPGAEPAEVRSPPRFSTGKKTGIPALPKSEIDLASFEDLAGDEPPAEPPQRKRVDKLFLPDGKSDDYLPAAAADQDINPEILDNTPPDSIGEFSLEPTDLDHLFTFDTGAPLGFTGPSGIVPTEDQQSNHFVPVEDRWRSGFPEWDRYPKGHPWGDDVPYVEGHIWDPYNQNVLKGDFPIFGQHTFLNVTGVVQTFQEYRQLPTPATGHESTFNPFTNDFFGNPNQYFTTNFFRLRFDLFHGNAGFKPVDWRVVVEPVFNMNDLRVRELGVINPDVREGTNRFRDFMALETYFVEAKLADLSPDYDFVSARVGTQPFVSDFRGFIFADNNRGVRLFGTRLANRDQFNVVAFDQLEKDTNSQLNTFDDRHQWIIIANYSRQDFIFPGYTLAGSFHYDHDMASLKYDENDELVRPDPAGVAMPHTVNAFYYGIAGDGHIGRINVSHAAYWVRGNDSMNPIAGRPMEIDAQMAAAEISYDRDWVRFRTSYFYASGQHEANSKVGKGFDSIFDNPNFAGGRFSYWQRQPIKLLGVNLKQKESLVPDLRSSKIEGQANFSNPGLQLVNAGMDIQVTPNCRVFCNANYLWFDATQVLEQFTFQKNISRQIGTDLSIGTEYRPFLNDNVIIFAGYAALLPGNGLNEIYGAVDPTHFKDPQIHSLPAMNAVFPDEAVAKSQSCLACHQKVEDPHSSGALQLGCVDCHGGNASAPTKEQAHVPAQLGAAWPTSGNPVRSYTLLNYESPEFIRFVNPGDLRIAHISCGTTGCHPRETLDVKKSMMTHGCMLWGAALYNNGAVPFKWPRYGESYSMNGAPQRLQTVPPPTAEETAKKGILPFLDPLPRFQITHPGNVLRIFERGGRFNIETGIPERLEEPGRPRARLSNRGLGTQVRTDPVFIGLQKTRLLDPTLNFLGTNDHAGDYRSSGCTSCHVVYANDRSPVHSGPYAQYGNKGLAASAVDDFVKSIDPTIPKNEPGHPIAHRFTRAIPTSQCIVCHMHPGTNVLNSYLGYMWWDEETDGEFMYPGEKPRPTSEQVVQANMSNPDGTAANGNWSNPEFLDKVSELNPSLRHTQFADFHGHGWVFRAVFKKDRDGTLLTHEGQPLHDPTTAAKQQAVLVPQLVKQLYQNRDWGAEDKEQLDKVKELEAQLQKMRQNIPVHMLDIHLEKGMHCVDCHFIQDSHGDSKLYGEVRAAIEIQCTDCHGDVDRKAAWVVGNRVQMRTSGPAAADRGDKNHNGRNLTAMRTPFGKRRFDVRGDRIIQNSMVEENLSWEVTQVADTINPKKPQYNALSALAKTIRTNEEGAFQWGNVPDDPAKCAHSTGNVGCIACHTSWNPSCYGCHLPQRATRKSPDLHNEGDITRNQVLYNFQTLRDDVFMLARDGNVTGNKIGPARSSCAIHVGSYNINRESVYTQQQTISAEGPSGIAFSTNVPHTVRGRGETKTCNDCHLSEKEDNNAIMAQLLMQGTNSTNLMGRYCWVAGGAKGLMGVVATEREEPQAVLGSSLHELAYPEQYRKHVGRRGKLIQAFKHPGTDVSDGLLHPFQKAEILSLQLRGEYVYAACGEAGMRIFDVSFVDDKGFSQRVFTAPVSPLGQQFYVRTKYATSVAAPTTIAPDPTRTHLPENFEPNIHSIYAYIYVTDREEGLILVGAGTLLDGNPENNCVERALTFNPDGILCGAKSVTIVGTYAYVCCNAGLVVISLEDPLKPHVTAVLGTDVLQSPRSVQVQFRYGFVCDNEGLKVLDVTDLSSPRLVSLLPLADARSVYVARTYAYVAGGTDGLVIVDIKNPLAPRIDQVFDAYGQINDLYDVKLGITYVSQFAYLADGFNGMKIVQLTSPETQGNDGFSPRPTPKLIACYPMPRGGCAKAISEAVDRDRAVDESGNQIAVFGRVGAKPLSYDEQRRLYQRPDGSVWKVPDFAPDYTIPDARDREIELHHQIEAYFGKSGLRKQKK
jgi:hypothetical protein